jgi:glucose-6-phosphate isomerase
MTGRTSVPPLHEQPAWSALRLHRKRLGGSSLRALFADDPAGPQGFKAQTDSWFLDYSKNLLDQEALQALILAEARALGSAIDAMFSGERINSTEERAALHVALRSPRDDHILGDGTDVIPEVHAELEHMAAFAEQVRCGAWRGHTGKRIRTVVNRISHVPAPAPSSTTRCSWRTASPRPRPWPSGVRSMRSGRLGRQAISHRTGRSPATGRATP